MIRRPTSSLVLVALVALSGCNGLNEQPLDVADADDEHWRSAQAVCDRFRGDGDWTMPDLQPVLKERARDHNIQVSSFEDLVAHRCPETGARIEALEEARYGRGPLASQTPTPTGPEHPARAQALVAELRARDANAAARGEPVEALDWAHLTDEQLMDVLRPVCDLRRAAGGNTGRVNEPRALIEQLLTPAPHTEGEPQSVRSWAGELDAAIATYYC